MAFRVSELDPSAGDVWNAFLVTSVNGTYCHRFEWRAVLESSYGLTTKYLTVHNGDELLAVFPIVLLPGPGRRAVSMAFCNYGGLVTATDGQGQQEELLAACAKYLSNIGINKFEVREKFAMPDESNEVTSIITMPNSIEDLWRLIGERVRNKVRKAEKMGLTTQWGREQVGACYDVYAANMGRLGTPVHARRFFEAIVGEFAGDADVLTVRLADKVIAAMLLIKHGDTWADPFTSSLPGYLQYNPNMLLYWSALRNACEHGADFFDFGRSQLGSGTYKFKRQWGAVSYPLEYRTYKGGAASNQASTKLYRGAAGGVVSGVWSRLPRRLQLSLGPVLRRYIP